MRVDQNHAGIMFDCRAGIPACRQAGALALQNSRSVLGTACNATASANYFDHSTMEHRLESLCAAQASRPVFLTHVASTLRENPIRLF